jgi:hypothetical protein
MRGVSRCGLLFRHVFVIAIVAMALTACAGERSPESSRWSLLPHAMGRKTPLRQAGEVAGSQGAHVEQVTLSHEGVDRLVLSIDYLERPPSAPRRLQGSFGPFDAPGSVLSTFLIKPTHATDDRAIAVTSPSAGQPWQGDVSEFNQSSPYVPVSVSVDRDVQTIVLDLAGQDDALGAGPFSADVEIDRNIIAPQSTELAFDLWPMGSPTCDWNTPTPARAITSTNRPSVARSTMPAPSTFEAPVAVPGADSTGFVSYPGARCSAGDNAALVERTTKSVLVICENQSKAFYYRGSRVSDNASITLGNAKPAPDGFNVVNPADGTRYEIRNSGLTIISGGQAYSEQVVDYWSKT